MSELTPFLQDTLKELEDCIISAVEAMAKLQNKLSVLPEHSELLDSLQCFSPMLSTVHEEMQETMSKQEQTL